MQSLKLPLNDSRALPNKTRDDDLSADLQDVSLPTNPESILTNLNAVHNYLKNLNIGEVDHIALKRYQDILQKFYESSTNKTREISEIYNKINQQFLKVEKEILQQNSSSSTSTKLPQILEVQTQRSIGTPRQTTPTFTPRDDLIITQQLRILELRGIERDLNLKINQLQETIKEIEEQKTQYQQKLSFYQEQNKFLDKSNNNLQDQLKSLEKKLEEQLQDLKSLKDENDKLIQEKKLMQENKEQLSEQFARERINFLASINQTLEEIRAVENHKIKLEQEISEYKINANELKKQIQELTQTNQELVQTNRDLLTYAHELELEKTLRDNPIDPLFSEIYSQSNRSSRDVGNRISLEENQLLSSSVLGELITQGARANEDDFPLENISQASSDASMQRLDGNFKNPIYLSNQPISSQPDSGSNESKILALIHKPSIETKDQSDHERDQSFQAQKDLQSEKLTGTSNYFEEELTKKIAEELAKKTDRNSPIAISSTPPNTKQNLTPSSANPPTVATATLGFATQSSSSDSDSPAQQQKPSNSPLIQPQPNQLPSTTASQGAELNSSNPLLRNTQSSQTSCFARLLLRCASPATPD